MKLGCAYDEATDLGPVVNAGHKEKICNWIQKGIDEGAELVLDGRNVVVPGYENGFFVGPTILDHVTPEMTVGNREIFGPVTCIKRVKDYEEGIAIMNANHLQTVPVSLHRADITAVNSLWRQTAVW